MIFFTRLVDIVRIVILRILPSVGLNNSFCSSGVFYTYARNFLVFARSLSLLPVPYENYVKLLEYCHMRVNDLMLV